MVWTVLPVYSWSVSPIVAPVELCSGNSTLSRISHVGLYGSEKLRKMSKFLGTRELSSFQLLLHALGGDKDQGVSLPGYIRKRTASHPTSHRVTWSSDTQDFRPRQEDAVFGFSRPGARSHSLILSTSARACAAKVWESTCGGCWA